MDMDFYSFYRAVNKEHSEIQEFIVNDKTYLLKKEEGKYNIYNDLGIVINPISFSRNLSEIEVKSIVSIYDNIEAIRAKHT